MTTRLAPTTVRAVPPAFAGIYSHATEIRNPTQLLFIAGQIGMTREGETQEGFERQCHQAMDNVEAILEHAGLHPDDMLRVVYYLTDPADLPSLTAIRRERWFGSQPPAVTTLVVAGLAAADLKVEIEVTAGR